MDTPSNNDGRKVEEGGTHDPALLQPHPASTIFPAALPDEYAALRDDIVKHGLIDPIMLFDGKILEGNTRYRACVEAGVTPRFEVYDGDDPVAYVVSKNLHRRHLTPIQKAAVAALAKDAYEAAARERKAQATGRPRGEKSLTARAQQETDKGTAMAHAAKAVGASERSAYDAHKILRKDPAVFNELLTGKQTSMRAALRAVGSDKGAAGRDTPPTARRRPGAQRKAAPKPAKQVPEHVAAQARIRARDAELKYESMLNAPPNKLNIPMLDRASKVQELLLELSGLKPEVAVTQMPALRCREYAGEHSATMAAWWARFVELCEERRRTETPGLPPVYKRSRLAAVNPVMGGGGVRLTPAAQAVSDWLEKQNEPVTVVEAAVAVRVTRDTAHKALRQICQMGDAEEIGKAGSFILYQWTGA